MTDPHNQAPPRLLDDPSLGAQLRDDLQHARARAMPYDLDAGLARFEQSLQAGAATAATGGGAALGLRVVAWLLGAATIAGAVVGAAALVEQAQRRDQLSERSAPVAVLDRPQTSQPQLRAGGVAVVGSSPAATAPALRGPAGDSAVEASPVGPAADARASAGDGEVDASATSPRPNSKPASEPTGGSLADEAKQINAARKALATDPARALELAEAAASQFPDGAMVQEREGYAILALAKLGRAQEARSRSVAYLERWPNGTLARRVRDAVAP